MGKQAFAIEATTEEIQSGTQRLRCGCVVNPPGAREGLRIFTPCPLIGQVWETYRSLSRTLWNEPDNRPLAEAAWASCSSHVRAQRSGKVEGLTGKGKAVERNWGQGE